MFLSYENNIRLMKTRYMLNGEENMFRIEINMVLEVFDEVFRAEKIIQAQVNTSSLIKLFSIAADNGSCILIEFRRLHKEEEIYISLTNKSISKFNLEIKSENPLNSSTNDKSMQIMISDVQGKLIAKALRSREEAVMGLMTDGNLFFELYDKTSKDEYCSIWKHILKAELITTEKVEFEEAPKKENINEFEFSDFSSFELDDLDLQM